jgi:hypothetical protein
MAIRPDTVKEVLASLRGYKVRPVRAAQIAREVERVNDAARKAAAHGDFNAQPTDFSVVLTELARK